MKRFIALATVLLTVAFSAAATPRSFQLSSPDGQLTLDVQTAPQISYQLSCKGTPVMAPSTLSVQLADGTAYDGAVRFEKALRRSVDGSFAAHVYKRAEVREKYNELTLRYKTFDVVFRAYDAGIAWRFVSRSKKDFIVRDEQAEFRFAEDVEAMVPYVKPDSPRDPFMHGFEAYYDIHPLSAWKEAQKSMLPTVSEAHRAGRLQQAAGCGTHHRRLYSEAACRSRTALAHRGRGAERQPAARQRPRL